MGAEGFENAAKVHETPREPTKEHEEAPTPDVVRDASLGPDDALRAAIHAAVDAGLYQRARTLLDVLERTSAPAQVVDIRDRDRRK